MSTTTLELKALRFEKSPRPPFPKGEKRPDPNHAPLSKRGWGIFQTVSSEVAPDEYGLFTAKRKLLF
jgi:hypothetical protein